MPMTEANVRALRTNHDEECFVCDKPISKGSVAVGIAFKVVLPLGVASIDIVKYFHVPACGDFLEGTLKKKLAQAKRAL